MEVSRQEVEGEMSPFLIAAFVAQDTVASSTATNLSTGPSRSDGLGAHDAQHRGADKQTDRKKHTTIL